MARLLKNREIGFFVKIWALVYLSLIFLLTLLFDEMSLMVFSILFLFSIPLYLDLERFLEVCIVLSSISYYFMGADEAVLSIYTIYAVLCVVRFCFTSHKRKFNNIFFRLLIILVFFYSYKLSSMSTFSGTMELVYIVLMSFIVSAIAKIDDSDPLAFLPALASYVIFFFVLMVMLNPISDGERITFSYQVNANGFGFASALMTCIILLSLIIKKQKQRGLYITFSVLGFILVLLSGSRNSIIAVSFSIFLFYITNSRRQNKIGLILKLLTITMAFMFAGYFVTSTIGLDMSRFSIESVIDSKGSNRMNIWSEIIPFIVAGYLWWGYGPGKAGSTETLTTLVHREYNSTHNTFVESFSETGLIGFVVFMVIIIYTYVNYHKLVKAKSQWGIAYGMFVFILFASIGESYFNDVLLWMIIGLSTSIKNNKQYEKVN